MKPPDSFDFWYAVNNTEILHMPTRHLETFGATVLNYHLVSELMDSTNQIKVREGRMQANRPQIITLDAYSQTVLEGFANLLSLLFRILAYHFCLLLQRLTLLFA